LEPLDDETGRKTKPPRTYREVRAPRNSARHLDRARQGKKGQKRQNNDLITTRRKTEKNTKKGKKLLFWTYRPKGPNEREKMTPDYKKINDLNDKAKELADDIRANLDDATDWYSQIHLDNAEKLFGDFKQVWQVMTEERKRLGL
jgi:hypothetical protein